MAEFVYNNPSIYILLDCSKCACLSRRLSCFALFILIFFSFHSVTVSQHSIKEDKNIKCSDDIFTEHFNCSSNDCQYGQDAVVNCSVPKTVDCKEHAFIREMNCRFCYQTDPSEHECEVKTQCKTLESVNRRKYATNCTVKKTTRCLGHRTFRKLLLCNWTSGYRWSTAVVLSIVNRETWFGSPANFKEVNNRTTIYVGSLTLGGFGVDRFYLGYWKEGLAKLFTFGGLGVWTLVDFILIVSEYVSPGDGSLYIF